MAGANWAKTNCSFHKHKQRPRKTLSIFSFFFSFALRVSANPSPLQPFSCLTIKVAHSHTRRNEIHWMQTCVCGSGTDYVILYQMDEQTIVFFFPFELHVASELTHIRVPLWRWVDDKKIYRKTKIGALVCMEKYESTNCIHLLCRPPCDHHTVKRWRFVCDSECRRARWVRRVTCTRRRVPNVHMTSECILCELWWFIRRWLKRFIKKKNETKWKIHISNLWHAILYYARGQAKTEHIARDTWLIRGGLLNRST